MRDEETKVLGVYMSLPTRTASMPHRERPRRSRSCNKNAAWGTMRRLTLHASALTDDEYTLYTHALTELAKVDVNQPQGTGGAQGSNGDDEYYEGIRLG